MPIKILTFHCANNYGAVLQAYALQSILKRYCLNVSVLDYHPEFLILPYLPYFKAGESAFRIKHNVINRGLRIMLSIVRYYLLGERTKAQKFDNFRTNRLDLKDFPPNDYSAIGAVVLGSDQIWNKRLTGGDTTYFYSNVPKGDTKVIAYAASIGNDKSTQDELDFLKENIQNVDYISVREETAQKVLSSICIKPVVTVLDPTLLLKSTDDEWRRLVFENVYGRYILLYQMSDDPNTLKICRFVAKRLNLKIIEVMFRPLGRHDLNLHNKITTAGPEEFVTLFAHAQYVVTSSFHGTAFSLIFNKQFVTVAHPTAGSRMRDLLARIGLSERIVSSIDDLPKGDVDYSVINSRLDTERRKSLDFIESALGVR